MLDPRQRDRYSGRPLPGNVSRISRIGLTSLHKRLHIGWWHQPYLVTKCCNLARPVMRTPTSLDTDQTRRLLFEKPQNLTASQSTVENRRAIGVRAVNLKNLFRTYLKIEIVSRSAIEEE